MVKSRFYTFTSLCFLSAGFAFTLLFLHLALHLAGITLWEHYPFDKEQDLGFLILGFAGAAFCFLLFSYKFKILKVDEADQMILVKNFLTRKQKIFKFSELDGYQVTVVRYGKGRGTPSNAIRLVKNKSTLVQLDEKFCSNIEEIRNSLSQLQFLGIDIDWTKDGAD